jgi:uncharacterized RDD family membrane protein YckC
MNSFNNRPINAGIRLATMLLDHIFMTIIIMVFFLPSMIAGFSNAFKITHQQANFNFMEGPMEYISLFGLGLYFSKDAFNGRSISKRILKLQVVDNATGQVASPLKCFIRNIFCIIWPIEAIVALINPGRRIGDRVAGTRLVYYNPALEQPKASIGGVILSVILSYGLMLLIFQLIPKIEGSKINYSEASYNSAESKELERLFTDSLGKVLTPDIRVYDSVKDENIKYISTILRLRKNYIDDDNSYNQLHEISTNLIYSKFPKKSFTGQIKYVYQGDGQFQSRETTIGTYIRPQK